MRRAGALLGLVLTLGLSAIAADAQTTQLRKLDTENDARAFAAVGRLDARVGSSCTGTLIAPDLVLTAAHCFYHPRTNQLIPADGMIFRAGLTHGQASAERVVAQVVAHQGFVPGKPLTAQNVIHDVALLRLDTPIPSHVLSPFAIHAGPIGDGPVSVVSYGRGRSETLSRQNKCQVLGRQNRVIAMDCDVTFGSSGAPVFTHLNGRGRILSVVSGMGQFQGAKVSYGMELTPVLAELKSTLRATAPRPKAQVRRLSIGGGKATTGAKFVKP